MKTKIYDVVNQRSEVIAARLIESEALVVRSSKMAEERQRVQQKIKREGKRDHFYMFNNGESFANGNRPVDVSELKKSKLIS